MANGAHTDLSAHQHAYARFIGIAKVAAIVVAVLAFAVILVISR